MKPEPVPVAPKKKFAILFGYNGAKYQGLQYNKGALTIESVLFAALGDIGLISQSNLESLQKVCWTRAARTDKGVHALGQVVSAKLCLAPIKIKSAIINVNKTLPSDIEVFDIIRVKKKFNSKLRCYGRKYCYTFPSLILGENYDVSKLNLLLRKFVGTKPYHNFTRRVAPNDPARFRFIKSCEATVFDFNGVNYTFVSIEGQSFLLNQIRKMVGLAIITVLTKSSKEVFDKAFENISFDTPMAPAEGLLLQACLFPTYNTGCISYENSDSFVEVDTERRRPIQFEVGDIKARVEKFYKNLVLPDIIKSETDGKIFSNWVSEEIEKEFPRICQKRKGEYSDYENYKEKKRASKERFIQSKKERD